MLNRAWRWYRTVGTPVTLTTRLSVKQCKAKLDDNSVPWQTRNPFGLRAYRLLWIRQNEFKLQHRRQFIRQPFAGTLTPTHSDGTRIEGAVMHDLSFFAFASFIAMVSPIAGGLTYGEIGWIGGAVISLLMFVAALAARLAEGRSQRPQQLRTWLEKTLQAESMVITDPNHAPLVIQSND